MELEGFPEKRKMASGDVKFPSVVKIYKSRVDIGRMWFWRGGKSGVKAKWGLW